MINGFDCDGVITVGIYPGHSDVIITGRSYEEKDETMRMLCKRGLGHIKVYYNMARYEAKTRESSGYHKAEIINLIHEHLKNKIETFFEDDPIQAAIIEKECPHVNVVRIVHDLTDKENVRHIDDF